MANKSVRMSQLNASKHAAAGHDGVLSTSSGEIVVKPCKQSEVDFYESIGSHPELAYYIPKYLGILSLSDSRSAQAPGSVVVSSKNNPGVPLTTAPGDPTVIENQWTPSGGGKIQTDLAIVLENVALAFQKPNILDVKLGSRLWADDAPPAKRAKLDKAAEVSTSKPLGFRIAGMKVYRGNESGVLHEVNADGYRVFDKDYGRAFTAETVHEGFEDFFPLPRMSKPHGPLRKVIRRFVDDLDGIATAIGNTESRMYSASLLFVYEGDEAVLQAGLLKEKEILADFSSQSEGAAAEGACGEPSDTRLSTEDQGIDDEDDFEGLDAGRPQFPAIQSLKIIDFAHACWTPGQGPDENILHGIRNVQKMLNEVAG